MRKTYTEPQIRDFLIDALHNCTGFKRMYILDNMHREYFIKDAMGLDSLDIGTILMNISDTFKVKLSIYQEELFVGSWSGDRLVQELTRWINDTYTCVNNKDMRVNKGDRTICSLTELPCTNGTNDDKQNGRIPCSATQCILFRNVMKQR